MTTSSPSEPTLSEPTLSERTLSELILEGARRVPMQCFDVLYERKSVERQEVSMCCAVGAIDAALAPDGPLLVANMATHERDVLFASAERLPGAKTLAERLRVLHKHRVERRKTYRNGPDGLLESIVYMNDVLRFSRESIAVVLANHGL